MTLRTLIRTRAAPGRRLVLLLAAGVAVVLVGLSADPRADAANNYSSTLYLSSTTSTLLAGSWQLVSSAPSSANTSTQNRIALGATGYQDFQPGFNPGGIASTPAPAASASTTPNGKGWLVDGSGAVTFAAGTWTFNNTVTDINNNGVATLAVGMWKVKISGGSITSSTLLVDPDCTASPCPSGAAPGAASPGTNFVGGAAVSVSLSPSLPSFSLASDEHLYVQYWRWETTGMSSGGTSARLGKLTSNDGTSAITHPSANAWPDVPTPGAVAARTNVTPQLSTTYSDADGDNGTVSFQLCSDSACNTVLQSYTTATVASGTAVNWTPTSLADGKYYWRAQSTDSNSNTSGWSATISFTVDTTSPTAPALGSIAARINNTTPTLAATFSDPDGAADTGTLSIQLCSTSGCATVLQSGSSAAGIANGASGTWTPSALSDGTYYFRDRNALVPALLHERVCHGPAERLVGRRDRKRRERDVDAVSALRRHLLLPCTCARRRRQLVELVRCDELCRRHDGAEHAQPLGGRALRDELPDPFRLVLGSGRRRHRQCDDPAVQRQPVQRRGRQRHLALAAVGPRRRHLLLACARAGHGGQPVRLVGSGQLHAGRPGSEHADVGRRRRVDERDAAALGGVLRPRCVGHRDAVVPAVHVERVHERAPEPYLR